MNLRVDLILPGEQRSANLINMRTLWRIASIGGPLLLAALVGAMALNMLSLSTRVKMAETAWQEAEPKKNDVLKLKDRVQTHEAMLQELEGWRKAHVDWYRQLQGVQDAVSPSTQLTTLRVSQTLQLVDQKAPGRVFTMSLEGRAPAASAEHDVETLQTDFKENTPFSNLVQAVKVPKYGVDKEDRANRSFQIDCEYVPMYFEP